MITRPRTHFALFAQLTMVASVWVWPIAIAAGAPAADDTVKPVESASAMADLSCKLQQGGMFRYSIRSRQVRQRHMPDESIVKWITRRTAVISCEVLEPDPEIGPRVRVTFDELSCTLMSPNKALRFTSANKHMNIVGAPMTLAMEPIVGSHITLTLDDTGVIRRVEGADELLKEKELRQYAEHIVGAEAIDRLLGPLFRSIAQPSGDTGSAPWSSARRIEFPEFASIDFDEHWTIGRRQAGRVTFRVESDAIAEINERWPDAVLSDSRTIGSYTWDELTGRLFHTEINRFYVIDLENDPDGPTIAGEEVLTISAPLGDN